MFILGIAGAIGSGKDSVGCHLAHTYGWQQAAYAEPFKAMLATLGIKEPERALKEEIMPEWGFSYRRATQLLGTEWGRNLNAEGDIWLRIMHKRIAHAKAIGRLGFVVTDVRFENEAQQMRNLGGRILFLTGRSTSESDHVSERSIVKQPGDFLVSNHGTIQELYSAVDDVLYVMGTK